MKRENYISWDNYFMAVALLAAKRSKDPATQVGACIVNADNRIVSVGYNGFPKNCSDDEFPWDKVGGFIDTKYAYVCHAELNCILNSALPIKGCKMFVTLFPCNECAKAIIQSGITEVIYLDDKNIQKEASLAALKMFKSSGVVVKKFHADMDEIIIKFKKD